MTNRIAPMLRDFLRHESAGGIVLMAAALLAMIAANSALAIHYLALLETPLIIGIGEAALEKPLLLWINDALMAVFFFLVGLEVKREVLAGQLSRWDQASLPVFAAIGGMFVPAAIYLGFNWNAPETVAGWAIPAATDIAFALGVLTLLGPRVPVALKALLLAIAVIDDIGAIAIIALFYTPNTDFALLGAAASVFGIMLLFCRARVGSSIPYVLLGTVLWFLVLKSGVHATLAGVLAAMAIPLHGKTESPLERMEHALHPWVAFLVIPLFGFANAGVSLLGISLETLLAPLPLGIMAGLLIGKQVGIVGFAWLAVKLRWARLPSELDWRMLHGLSLLAGIGFTMSLFIGNLAFTDQAQIEAVKLGVLSGSTIAALAGFFLLQSSLPKAVKRFTKEAANA